MKCPHCRTAFHPKGDERVFTIGSDVEYEQWQVKHITCPECQKIIIKLANYRQKAISASSGSRQIVGTEGEWTERYVHPKATSRPPAPPEVTQEFTEDYNEACLVLADSPKASAALSRRCLQNILREQAGATERDLAKAIQTVLDSNKLPSYLADDLDAVRHVGNFAAHPVKSQNTGEVLPVEPGEAEWNLDVIEGLFDFYFVEPVKAKERRNRLNEKLKDAGKGPMKSSSP